MKARVMETGGGVVKEGTDFGLSRFVAKRPRINNPMLPESTRCLSQLSDGLNTVMQKNHLRCHICSWNVDDHCLWRLLSFYWSFELITIYYIALISK